MTEKPLHVQVAEALGWEPWDHKLLGPRWRRPGSAHPEKAVPRYDTDWSATGPLIEKHMIIPRFGSGTWWAEADWPTYQKHIRWTGEGETPLIALCHLILSLKEAGKLAA